MMVTILNKIDSRWVGIFNPVFFVWSSLSGGSLQVGDRVIVASSMAGTKTGTLRYLGPADFAKGEWAGIELDAPLGE